MTGRDSGDQETSGSEHDSSNDDTLGVKETAQLADPSTASGKLKKAVQGTATLTSFFTRTTMTGAKPASTGKGQRTPRDSPPPPTVDQLRRMLEGRRVCADAPLSAEQPRAAPYLEDLMSSFLNSYFELYNPVGDGWCMYR
jgi:hypothetical protein